MNEDFLLDPDKENDLKIENGDFVIGASDLQHVALIVLADKGHFKQHPLLGAGIIRQVNGPGNAEIKRIIQKNLQADGIITKSIVIADGKILIKI